MNKIEKFLQKLNKKEFKKTQEIISLIEEGKLTNLKVKKLKGFNNLYRVKFQKFRIIFDNSNNEIIKVTNRDDNTYNL